MRGRIRAGQDPCGAGSVRGSHACMRSAESTHEHKRMPLHQLARPCMRAGSDSPPACAPHASTRRYCPRAGCRGVVQGIAAVHRTPPPLPAPAQPAQAGRTAGPLPPTPRGHRPLSSVITPPPPSLLPPALPDGCGIDGTTDTNDCRALECIPVCTGEADDDVISPWVRCWGHPSLGGKSPHTRPSSPPRLHTRPS